MTFTIDPIDLPAQADGPDAADFVALVDVRNRVESAILGTSALAMTPTAILPYLGDNPHRARRHFVARSAGRIVGRAVIAWSTAEGARDARLTVEVVPEERHHGIGSALLERVEAEAAGIGRDVLQADQAHQALAGGRRLASPTGFGDVPVDDPGVRFLLAHGYDLELVVRVSSLDLAARAESLPTILRTAQEQAGPDYRIVAWTGPTPDDRLDDLAALKTGMSTDAPMAGMEVSVDRWSADDVRDHGARQGATGRLLLTAAAEHVPSGRLVAFTEIEVDRGDRAAAVQEDTLVMRAHRGHRLGMLVKAANLVRLLDIAPTTTVVTTFNAEDNRPMLDVNEALGFVAIGHEGNWQTRVGDRTE